MMKLVTYDAIKDIKIIGMPTDYSDTLLNFVKEYRHKVDVLNYINRVACRFLDEKTRNYYMWWCVNEVKHLIKDKKIFHTLDVLKSYIEGKADIRMVKNAFRASKDAVENSFIIYNDIFKAYTKELEKNYHNLYFGIDSLPKFGDPPNCTLDVSNAVKVAILSHCINKAHHDGEIAARYAKSQHYNAKYAYEEAFSRYANLDVAHQVMHEVNRFYNITNADIKSSHSVYTITRAIAYPDDCQNDNAVWYAFSDSAEAVAANNPHQIAYETAYDYCDYYKDYLDKDFNSANDYFSLSLAHNAYNEAYNAYIDAINSKDINIKKQHNLQIDKLIQILENK